MRRHIRRAARANSAWADQWIEGPFTTNRAYRRSREGKRLLALVRQQITQKMGNR